MKLIRQHRVYLMGIAILEIVFFHSGLTLGNGEILKSFGKGGVDIFFFLSGIGLYQSLLKDRSMIAFYKRRILRLAPAYLPFIICWLMLKLPDVIATYGWDFIGVLRMILGNILMTEWMNGGLSFNWYIQSLFWFYLLAPIFFEIVNYVGESKFYSILFLLLIGGFNIVFINQPTLIAVSRFFIFVVGMMFAYAEENGKKIYYSVIYVLFLFGVLWLFYLYINCEPEFLWNSGLCWYPYGLITPGWCLILANIFEIIQKYKLTKCLMKLIGLIGGCTFEIYLIHIWLFEDFQDIFNVSNNLKWCAFAAFAVLCGIIYKKLLAVISNRIKFIVGTN